MGKDKSKEDFDFDNDPEFSENFYKYIEKVLSDIPGDIQKANTDTENTKADEINEDPVLSPVQSEEDPQNNEFDPMEEVAAAGMLLRNGINEESIDDQLCDISSSLAMQISAEMEAIGVGNNGRKKHWFLIQNGVVLALLCLIGFGFFFGFTKPGNKMLMGMGVNLSGKIWEVWTGNFADGEDAKEDLDYLDDDDLASNSEEIDPNTIKWPDHPGQGRKEEGVYNILLLGEEAIGSGSARGRTDVIIIATLNTNSKTIKLTSLLRDTLVQIPGYNDNKLNTAYEKGGLDLMYETISRNFDIHLDGAAMVNFENFEKIIDKLGGLEITLTSGEAKYLNSTNYISEKKNRTVVKGTQILNGNQVLGYARVRKRATITGNNNDYGRTDRHRIILNAIFDKYKTKSKVELAAVMLEMLPMVKTDIDDDCFELLLNAFIEMGTMEMTQLRIPVNGTFTDNVKVRGMDVLIPDLDENRKILHEFIFDDKVTSEQESNTTAAGN